VGDGGRRREWNATWNAVDTKLTTHSAAYLFGDVDSCMFTELCALLPASLVRMLLPASLVRMLLPASPRLMLVVAQVNCWNI
jgi:hypothetical protein